MSNQDRAEDGVWKQHGEVEKSKGSLLTEGQKEWITTPGFLTLWILILSYAVLKGGSAGTWAEIDGAASWVGYLGTSIVLTLLYAAIIKWVYIELKNVMMPSLR